ncbi:MAG: SCO7613 C-terminal domain-containing membrane protein [Rhodoglobus sp.]
MDTYLRYVGYVQFPRQPRDLSAEVCPACLTDRAGARCARCGLDLLSPLLEQLDLVSVDATAALDRRLELIGRIRHDSAAASAAALAAAPRSIAPAPEVTADITPEASTTATSMPPPTAARPVPSAEPRQHLGVQVILLIVGVSLLSIGAIFFLLYAFITFGLVWRSVIIVAVTIAAIAGATLLKRRRLTATAEAIASLGVVFVYLDVFALRANKMFGSDGVDGLLYWGMALLLSAIGFTVWHRLSGLRLPNIVAFIAFAPALALLVGGATAALDNDLRVFSSLAALALGSLAHPLGRYRIEKIIVASMGIIGLVLAGLLAPWLSDTDWVPAVELGIVSLIALTQVSLISRVGSPATIGKIAAGVGATAAASALLVMALRVNEPGFLAFWPIIPATAIALVLEFTARALTMGLAHVFARVAAWSAAAVGILCLLITAMFAVTPAIDLARAVSPRWLVPGDSVVTVSPQSVAALLALLVVVLFISAAWALSRTLAARVHMVAGAACAVLVLAIPMLGVLWAAVAAWLLAAGISVIAASVGRARQWRTDIRIIFVAAALIAILLAYTSSWASIDTWWFGSLGAVAVVIAIRTVTANVAVRAATLGLAAVLALIAASAVGWILDGPFASGTETSLDPLNTMGILAVVLLAGSALLARSLSVAEVRMLFWISLLASVWVIGMTALLLPDPNVLERLGLPYFVTSTVSVASTALSVALVVALVLWGLVRVAVALRVEQIAASILLAPALAWSLHCLTQSAAPTTVIATETSPPANTVAPIVAALIVAAGTLALMRLRPATGLRLAHEGGVALVAIPTTLAAIFGQLDITWLVLLITGVTTFLTAIASDGLFTSPSPRKHLGWLALALAAGGLWWALTINAITTVELYVLPLSGALLLVALLVWRAADRGTSHSTAPLIALAGLLVAIAPIAAVSITGTVIRTTVIVAVCMVLVLGASLAVRADALRPYLDVTVIAAASGLVIAGFGRPFGIILTGGGDDLQIDVWAASTFLVLISAAIIHTRISDEQTRHHRTEASIVTTVLAVAGLVVVELTVIGEGVASGNSINIARALAVLIVLSAIHVVSRLLTRAPFTSSVGWIALAGASITAITAVFAGALNPLEWATVILAAALLTVGVMRLRRDPTQGSWPCLGPGILVLLMPSLTASFIEAPIFRLVGIGVICIIAIVVGALARLQAPLILGSVIVLVHALRTFAPQITSVYQRTEWWVWAVVGGAVILFVALTLEKRIRDLKSIGSRLSALR